MSMPTSQPNYAWPDNEGNRDHEDFHGDPFLGLTSKECVVGAREGTQAMEHEFIFVVEPSAEACVLPAVPNSESAPASNPPGVQAWAVGDILTRGSGRGSADSNPAPD